MVEFAQRKMVQQGITPSTPESMGTGITSGLMDKAPDNLQAGIMATGQAIENLNRNLDKAESFEDIMNTVRGDNQPMEARVNELAGLVGEKDAKKTPKSVLTVLQPYFQILDVVQAQASPGGIADIPIEPKGEK